MNSPHNPTFSSATNNKLEAESRKSSSHFHPQHHEADNLPHPHASEHTGLASVDSPNQSGSLSPSAKTTPTSRTSSHKNSANEAPLKHDEDILASNNPQPPLRKPSRQLAQNTTEFANRAESSVHELAGSAQQFNKVISNLFLGQMQTATQAFMDLSRCRNPLGFAAIQSEWIQNSLHNISVAAERITELTTHASNSNISHAEEFAGNISRRVGKTK